jgi:hypothetical protein
LSDLVTLKLGRVFTHYQSDLERARDKALQDSAPILRRHVESSIRQRFYRTGAGLRSLQEEFVTEGIKKIYRLFPTAFYMIFGEYGTGRRGSTTGQPAPRGYKYGKRPGMAARKFARIAVGESRREIRDIHLLKVREFAQNLTRA